MTNESKQHHLGFESAGALNFSCNVYSNDGVINGVMQASVTAYGEKQLFTSDIAMYLSPDQARKLIKVLQAGIDFLEQEGR